MLNQVLAVAMACQWDKIWDSNLNINKISTVAVMAVDINNHSLVTQIRNTKHKPAVISNNQAPAHSGPPAHLPMDNTSSVNSLM